MTVRIRSVQPPPLLSTSTEVTVNMNVSGTEEQASAISPPADWNVAPVVAAAGNVPPAGIVMSAGQVVIMGAVVSSIVTTAIAVDIFPQSSVAVKVTVWVPVPSLVQMAVSSKPAALKLLVIVRSPSQPSLTMAFPVALSQAVISAILPAPSHSKVKS